MKPMVDRLAKEYEGKVEFRRYVDTGDPVGDKLAQQFQVQFVPTFVFVNKDGTVAGQPVVGEMTEQQIKDRLDALK